MDKKIQLTKDQYEAFDVINEKMLEKYDASEFILNRATERGEAYRTADGRTLYRTVERFTLTVCNYDTFRPRVLETLAKRERGEELAWRANSIVRLHDVVPFTQD